MNIYDRIINILLEARVEMFIEDRLDEKKLIGKQKKLDVNKNKKLDSEDFNMLRSGKRADEGMTADDLHARYGGSDSRVTAKLKSMLKPKQKPGVGTRSDVMGTSEKPKPTNGIKLRADEAKFEKGHGDVVKGAIRQDRFEKATGISPAKSEDARQKKHRETYGKAAPGRAIKARGRRQVDNP